MSTINLLPQDYVERRARHRANVLCLVLFAVVMSGVTGAALVSRRSGRRTLEVRNRVNASYAKAAELIAQMQELQAKKRSLCAKAETTASLVERVPRSTLLAIITEALPKGAAVTKFKLETKAPRVQQTQQGRAKRKGKKGSKFEAKKKGAAPPSLVQMEVTGLAQNDLQVARFMHALIRNKLLTGVDLVVSQEKMVDKVAVREFQVKLQLRPGADAIDILGDPQAPKPAEGVARSGGQGDLP